MGPTDGWDHFATSRRSQKRARVERLLVATPRDTAGCHVAAAGAAREELMRLGFEDPSWESVTAGRRPAMPDVEDRQIGMA